MKHKCNVNVLLEKASRTDARIYAYDKSVHSITVVSEKGPCVALELSTGRTLHEGFDESPLERARHDAISRSHQPPRVGVVETDSNSAVFNPRGINQSNALGKAEPAVAPYDITYSHGRGQINLDCTQQGLQVPMLDGSPFLQGATILEAQTANGLWALKVLSKNVSKLHVLRGNEVVHLHELDVSADRGNFLLHESGKVALIGVEGVKVIEFGAAAQALPLPKMAKCHSELFFEVGDYALSVYGGKFTHILRWDHGKLEATHKIGRVAFTHAGRKSGALD